MEIFVVLLIEKIKKNDEFVINRNLKENDLIYGLKKGRKGKEWKDEEEKIVVNRNIWGVPHSKWKQSNLDWKSPKAEIMFKSGSGMFSNKNSFQRKMAHLADSENTDILNGKVKEEFKNMEKLKRPNKNQMEITNNKKLEEIKQIVEDIPLSKLKDDKKECFIMAQSTVPFYENKHINRRISIPSRLHESDVYKYEISFPIFGRQQDDSIKKVMGENGIHYFDLNEVENKDGRVKLNFKIRDNDGKASEKITNLQNYFNLNGDEIKIKKIVEKEKKFNKNNRNKEALGGVKAIVFIDKADKGEGLKKMIGNGRHNFSKGFEQINYGYKNK